VALKDGLQATIAYFALRTATPEFVTAPGPSPTRRPQGRGRLTLASQQ
jgi:UDP-glucuronate decarboxylase